MKHVLKRLGTVFFFFLVILALPGCEPEDPAEETAGETPRIAKQYERGPLKVEMTVSPSEITLADTFSLTIQGTIEAGWDLWMPDFGESLGEFRIQDFREESSADGNHQIHRQEYLLDIFLSGDYTIPPMKFRFRKADESEKPYAELLTEEIKLVVKPLTDGEVTPEAIRPLAGPVELPRETPWGWIALGTTLLAMMVGTGIWAVRRYLRRKRPATPAPSPYEVAYAALERLLSQEFLEKGETTPFVERLSAIVRGYIEGQFDIHAPEQTTEEFLHAAADSGKIRSEHELLLREFLSLADLAKFAKWVPEREEVLKQYEAAKRFLTETRRERPRAGSLQEAAT